jgi:hypothetical protein
MSESFFRRWSRRKAGHAQDEDSAARTDRLHPFEAAAEDAPAAGTGAAASGQPSLPSMKDVASLAPDADYSAFLARGVDKAVHRAAMKKLFSDPHFNVMDGLDIYIDDYTKPSPLPPGMLAALQHAKSTLDPKPLYKTQEEQEEEQRLAGQAGNAESGGADDEEGLGDGGEAVDENALVQADAENETHAHHADEEPLPSALMPLQEAPVTPKEPPSP